MSKPTRGIGDKWIDVCRLLNSRGKVITIIGDDPRVDVLKAAGDLAYSDAVRSKRTATVDGVEVPYVGLRELIRSKHTERDQDRIDARELQASETQRAKAEKPV